MRRVSHPRFHYDFFIIIIIINIVSAGPADKLRFLWLLLEALNFSQILFIFACI